MAKPTSSNFNIAQCQDILGFQEYLKRLRTVDDSIILNLNTTILTSSFQKDIEQNVSNCNRFHQQLKEAYEERDRLIQACLSDAEAKVAELKAASNQSEPDLAIQKELRRQQTRQRMIQKEVTVEQIIQDRSMKALQERCRPFGFPN